MLKKNTNYLVPITLRLVDRLKLKVTSKTVRTYFAQNRGSHLLLSLSEALFQWNTENIIIRLNTPPFPQLIKMPLPIVLKLNSPERDYILLSSISEQWVEYFSIHRGTVKESLNSFLEKSPSQALVSFPQKNSGQQDYFKKSKYEKIDLYYLLGSWTLILSLVLASLNQMNNYLSGLLLPFFFLNFIGLIINSLEIYLEPYTESEDSTFSKHFGTFLLFSPQINPITHFTCFSTLIIAIPLSGMEFQGILQLQVWIIAPFIGLNFLKLALYFSRQLPLLNTLITTVLLLLNYILLKYFPHDSTSQITLNVLVYFVLAMLFSVLIVAIIRPQANTIQSISTNTGKVSSCKRNAAQISNYPLLLPGFQNSGPLNFIKVQHFSSFAKPTELNCYLKIYRKAMPFLNLEQCWLSINLTLPPSNSIKEAEINQKIIFFLLHLSSSNETEVYQFFRWYFDNQAMQNLLTDTPSLSIPSSTPEQSFIKTIPDLNVSTQSPTQAFMLHPMIIKAQEQVGINYYLN